MARALTAIRFLSIFHMTLAYYFVFSPSTITQQNLVFILGESMHLPPAPSFDKPSGATAFIGILLFLLGVSDLTAASLSDDVSIPYWSSQAPVRVFFLFAVTGYTYIANPRPRNAPRFAAVTGATGENLHNALVFTWGFTELLAWFWVFLSVRDASRAWRAQRLEEEQNQKQQQRL